MRNKRSAEQWKIHHVNATITCIFNPSLHDLYTLTNILCLFVEVNQVLCLLVFIIFSQTKEEVMSHLSGLLTHSHLIIMSELSPLRSSLAGVPSSPPYLTFKCPRFSMSPRPQRWLHFKWAAVRRTPLTSLQTPGHAYWPKKDMNPAHLSRCFQWGPLFLFLL